MKLLPVLFFVVLCISTKAQKQLNGIILADNKQPVTGASIYLNNTSIGTTANSDGKFSITIPQGRFDLVISAIGYETENFAAIGSGADTTLTLYMKRKEEELQNVVVTPFLKDGWEKWGNFFLDNFLGTSSFSRHCHILNQNTIRFRFSKDRVLTATALEPLVIENNSLGYNIRYDLEEFTYEIDKHYLFFAGYAFFEQMDGSNSRKEIWEKNRAEAYTGSMMQFMRAVFRNRITEEGFDIYPLQKLTNKEKLRVTQAIRNNFIQTKNADGTGSLQDRNIDSNEYYRKIMKQSDYKDIINLNKQSGDSIAYAIDSTTAGVYFTDYLLVIYRNSKLPREYRQRYPDAGSTMSSQITLINSRPLSVLSSGYYYNPTDLLSLGYWSWSEKIAALLPFDYKPSR
jgi:hypothetical protein